MPPDLAVRRIATWNLEGRWDNRHRELIEAIDCDVLLLTEVPERVDLPGMSGHASTLRMAPKRHWAAVWSRHPITPLPDPHGASAMVEVLGMRVVSSILPWKGSGSGEPWVGSNTYGRTVEAVDVIVATQPTIWGGDWNHALQGREWSGSRAGQTYLVNALERLGLRAATADAPHQLDGLLSIDHIAVPISWTTSVEHHSALSDGGRLSDHDPYVIEVAPQSQGAPSQQGRM